MIVTRDYRRVSGLEITIRMSLDEFRETVEWLECVDPRDGATKDWRAWLDDVAPTRTQEASDGD